jgi:hypothetical protein
MSRGEYILGIALLGVTVGSLVATARLVRRTILPGWSGAPARLAEAVIGIAALIVVSELLGAVGVFRRWWLVAACVVMAIGTVAVLRRRTAPAGADLAAPSPGVLPVATAALALALTLVPWKDETRTALAHGMNAYDTVSYHMPLAAGFAQSASVTGIQYVWIDTVSFYPLDNELIHAVGLLLFGRDLLSPVLNLGWLGLALLAGWCIGRPRGIGPATMSATALVASLSVMVDSQGGSASSDIAGLALLLAAVAFVVSAPRLRGAHIVAALAAGLGVGTRLYLWAPVLALAVVAIVGVGRGQRRATAWWWLAGGVVGAGFWYARNLVAAGNPLPWFGVKLGGLLNLRSTGPPPGGEKSLASYITDPAFIRAHIVPQLSTAFGGRWWVVLGLAAAGIGVGLAAKTAPLVRRLALVTLAGTVAYVFTPLSASGTNASLFAYDTRYVIPEIALGAIVLALALSELGVQPLALALGLLLAVIVVVPFYVSAGTLVVIVLVASATAIVVYGTRAVPRPARVAGLVLLALAVVGLGWHEQRTYFHDRYRGAVLGEPVEPIYTALAGVSHKRIAVAGLYQSYPLYGVASTNRVDYPSSRTDGTKFTLPSTCSTWLLALSRGHYDYVVTARQGPDEPPAAAWTRRYPGAHELLASPPGFVRLGSPWRWELFGLPRAAGVNAQAACRGT